jgi:hypothetical protein
MNTPISDVLQRSKNTDISLRSRTITDEENVEDPQLDTHLFFKMSLVKCKCRARTILNSFVKDRLTALTALEEENLSILESYEAASKLETKHVQRKQFNDFLNYLKGLGLSTNYIKTPESPTYRVPCPASCLEVVERVPDSESALSRVEFYTMKNTELLQMLLSSFADHPDIKNTDILVMKSLAVSLYERCLLLGQCNSKLFSISDVFNRCVTLTQNLSTDACSLPLSLSREFLLQVYSEASLFFNALNLNSDIPNPSNSVILQLLSELQKSAKQIQTEESLSQMCALVADVFEGIEVYLETQAIIKARILSLLREGIANTENIEKQGDQEFGVLTKYLKLIVQNIASVKELTDTDSPLRVMKLTQGIFESIYEPCTKFFEKLKKLSTKSLVCGEEFESFWTHLLLVQDFLLKLLANLYPYEKSQLKLNYIAI